MQAKFPGKCEICGTVINKNAECGYNSETRQIYHYACKENENCRPTEEQRKITERLHFRTFDELEREGIPDIWKVPFLCPRSGSPD